MRNHQKFSLNQATYIPKIRDILNRGSPENTFSTEETLNGSQNFTQTDNLLNWLTHYQ